MTAAVTAPAITTAAFVPSGPSRLSPVLAPGRSLRRATAMVAAAVVVAATLPVVAVLSSSPPAPSQPQGADGPLALGSPAQALARVAPRFEANQGQFDPAVRFVSRASGYSLFLTPTEAVMAVGGAHQGASGAAEVVRMALVGAKADPEMTGGEVLGGVSNYLSGNDAAKWVTGVSSHSSVRYHGVYEGIDLVYHGDDEGRIEYDFEVAPGADPATIALDFSGAKSLALDPSGELVIATGAGELRQQKPTLYQERAGKRHQVPGQFVLNGNRVGFEVGAYDKALPLVIDPVLAYSTYLGGNADDVGNGIAVDPDGFAYVVGTSASLGFPTTEGALDPSCGSQERCQPESDERVVPQPPALDPRIESTEGSTARPDAFVTKLSPDGQVVYSTYLGGKGGDEGLAIAVDDSGRAYIAGRTESEDFPTTANAYDRTCGTDGRCNFRLTDEPTDGAGYGQTKADAFVTKLDHTGTLDLAKGAYSSFFGGSGEETRDWYMISHSSPLSETEPGDEIDYGYNPHLNPDREGASAAITVLGETVYLTSSTTSTDLIKAPGAPDTAPGYRPANAAYDSDCGTGGKGDCNKLAYKCSPRCMYVRQHSDLFVAELDTTLPPDNSHEALRYATYLGGSDDDVARGIAATRAKVAGDDSGQTRLYIVSSQECLGDSCINRNHCPVYAGSAIGECSEVPERPSDRPDRWEEWQNLPDGTPWPPPWPPDHLPELPISHWSSRIRVDMPELNTILPQQSGVRSLGWSKDINEAVGGVAADGAGNAWVTGKSSGKLATKADQAFQASYGGGPYDAFVARFSPDEGELRYATYLGGARRDIGRAIAVDSAGRAFVTGETASVDYANTTGDESFPTTTDRVQPPAVCPTGAPNDCPDNVDAFVAVVDPGTSGDDALVYSTQLGGDIPGPGSSSNTSDVGRAIALLEGGSGPSVYVGGVANSRNFPLVDPFSDVNTGGAEAFVARLVPGGPQPVVSRIKPDTGTSAGGDTVVVTGAHLAGATRLLFGDHSCPSPSCTFSVSGDGTTLTLTSPPLFNESSDTTVDISVTVPGAGTSVRTSSSKFTYVDGKFDPTATMSGPEKHLTATVLDGPACRTKPQPLPSYCGKVLVLGTGTSVNLYDPKAGPEGAWSSQTCDGTTTPSSECPNGLAHSRIGMGGPNQPGPAHTATLLDGPLAECQPHCGKVLVAGGAADPATELYDPATGTWSDAGDLNINRKHHTATLLTGSMCGLHCGKVLVVGGTERTNGSLSERAEAGRSAELFDPKALRVTTPDADPVETPDSIDPGPAPILYEPWSLAGVPQGPRAGGHTATLLAGPNCGSHCGKVLLVGGDQNDDPNSYSPQRVVEFFDPTAPPPVAFATTPSASSSSCAVMTGACAGVPRIGHTATLLQGPGCEPNCGKVLLVGGRAAAYPSLLGQLAVELFDPSAPDLASAFSHHSRLEEPRIHHSAVPLPGGRVLITGGLATVGNSSSGAGGHSITWTSERLEVYEPRSGGWRPGPRLRRAYGAAVLLKGAGSEVGDAEMCGTDCGKVLMAGGEFKLPSGREELLASAELYTPAPVAEAMDPSTGPAAGGTAVSITGSGFGDAMGVYFGTTKACSGCPVGSYSKLVAPSPKVADQASPEVWVAREGVGISRVPKSFDYIGSPGAVRNFVALPRSDNEIDLSFGAAGSVLDANPPAKDYIVKESRSPIDASNFDSAHSLCEAGICRFTPARVGQGLTLSVTKRSPGTRYHYAVRAMGGADQLGPISFAHATTTGIAPVRETTEGRQAIKGVPNQILYQRGYSLVGLPQGSVVASQSPLYGWFNQGARNATGGTATYSTQAPELAVAAGRGYWAWFSAPQLVSVSGSGLSAMDLALGGYRASMVGNPSGNATSTISGHDYTARWDPRLNDGAGGYHISGYQQPQDLAVGEGIWAFSYRDTTLRLRAR